MNKIKATIEKISGLDLKLMAQAQERLDNLTKPQGSLGKLEELAKLVVGITAKEDPNLKNKVIFTFAADHGVTEEGVSAFPKEVTAQMVYNFLRGGAGINVLAKHIGAKVVVADLGVASKLEAQGFKDAKINFGTKNFTNGPAMNKDEAKKAIETGINIFDEEFKNGIDIIGIGEMGIGNTTSASAITAVCTRHPVAKVTGQGTGIDEESLKNKISVIEKAIQVNNPNPHDAIDILSKVGGFEIGGLAGVILAAASKRIPIVIDGFISSSAALIASILAPKTKDYMIASHSSVEQGHKIILAHLGLEPILNLNLRLGEGTGAALGINMVEAAVKILTQMATFKKAKVSERLND